MAVITEAIILAGGLGTRLQVEVPHLPKCMAPVAERPFLSFVIDALRMQGIQKFVFALGYKYDVIENYLQKQYPTLEYVTVIEEEPMGTGGATRIALQNASTEDVLVTNGDTLFKIELEEVAAVHFTNGAECTLALKPMQIFDRYGVVSIDDAGAVESFKEKQFYEKGLINGGTYLINRERFLKRPFPSKFSIEKDYLEKELTGSILFGSVQSGYFIDIGIPEDYKKANRELAPSLLNLKDINKSWTLFLDRDGVINLERFERYVLHWGEFEFLDGVLTSFQKLNERFNRILIVSNQRGVTKNLMTEYDLNDVHKNMLHAIEESGGHIERIYYCIEKGDTYFDRKPNPGMALKAKKDFPDIDFSKSIMVGNKPSDMRFGRAAGMFTVFVTTTNPHQPFPHPDIDMRFDSLEAFTDAL